MKTHWPDFPMLRSRSAGTWATGLVSSRGGAKAPLHHSQLSVDQAPWLVEYDLDPEKGLKFAESLLQRSWTLWRYRELLPVEDWSLRVSLGEGGTPLLPLRRTGPPGIEILLKREEGNPTGSFKARGLALAVTRALELGAPGIQLPSAGNAALAASAYAAAAGLPCRIALPHDTPQTFSDRCRAYGCEVLRGGQTLVEAAALLQEQDRGFWDLSTFKEPYRVEGKKTMGLELAEQLGWSLPDWIVYPTGGGTGIVAMAKAFAELRRLGLVTGKTSRLVVVQMAGCAPLVEAFAKGAVHAATWAEPQTNVWGLRVPKSIADFLILQALRESRGTALSVPESSLAPLTAKIGRCEGIWIGPEGAAALAATLRLIEEGSIVDGQRVVVFQTGHPANYA
jgi:threonine synthase